MIRISKLALGTVQFGIPYGVANQRGQIGLEEAKEILITAKSAGIDTLDTAIAYGNSEQRLGEIGVSSWKVVSKLPKMPDSVSDVLYWVQETVSGSLDRLQLTKLYGLLLHNPEHLLQPEGRKLYDSLKILKEKGWVDKIGISIYSPRELDALSNHFSFDLVQSPCNILDRNLAQSGWLERLKQSEVEIHVRSVFLQGLLLMKSEERPEKFKRWQSFWNQWDDWLHQSNISPLQACLNYVFSLRDISKIVIGIDRLSQLEEILNVEEINLQIPDFIANNDSDLIYPYNWTKL